MRKSLFFASFLRVLLVYLPVCNVIAAIRCLQGLAIPQSFFHLLLEPHGQPSLRPCFTFEMFLLILPLVSMQALWNFLDCDPESMISSVIWDNSVSNALQCSINRLFWSTTQTIFSPIWAIEVSSLLLSLPCRSNSSIISLLFSVIFLSACFCKQFQKNGVSMRSTKVCDLQLKLVCLFVSVRQSCNFLIYFWLRASLSDKFYASVKCRPHTRTKSEM